MKFITVAAVKAKGTKVGNLLLLVLLLSFLDNAVKECKMFVPFTPISNIALSIGILSTNERFLLFDLLNIIICVRDNFFMLDVEKMYTLFDFF